MATNEKTKLDLGHDHSESFNSGYLPVGDIHELYYEQYGNVAGKPGESSWSLQCSARET